MTLDGFYRLLTLSDIDVWHREQLPDVGYARSTHRMLVGLRWVKKRLHLLMLGVLHHQHHALPVWVAYKCVRHGRDIEYFADTERFGRALIRQIQQAAQDGCLHLLLHRRLVWRFHHCQRHHPPQQRIAQLELAQTGPFELLPQS